MAPPPDAAKVRPAAASSNMRRRRCSRAITVCCSCCFGPVHQIVFSRNKLRFRSCGKGDGIRCGGSVVGLGMAQHQIPVAEAHALVGAPANRGGVIRGRGGRACALASEHTPGRFFLAHDHDVFHVRRRTTCLQNRSVAHYIVWGGTQRSCSPGLLYYFLSLSLCSHRMKWAERSLSMGGCAFLVCIPWKCCAREMK